MHIAQNELMHVEALLKEALSLGALSLMKQATVVRNHGKTPEYILAECLVAAFRMHHSMEGGEPV